MSSDGAQMQLGWQGPSIDRAAYRRREALGLAITKINCVMVRVAGTDVYVRSNKPGARELNRKTSGAIAWRVADGILYLG